MLAFVNVHNLHRTAREVVSTFRRTTSEPVPFGGSITLSTGTQLTGTRNAFGAIVWTITERPGDVLTVAEWHELCDVQQGRNTVPAPEPEPVKVEPLRASININRKRFLNDVKQAVSHNKRAARQLVVMRFGERVRLESFSGHSLLTLCVQTETTDGELSIVIPAERLATILAKLTAVDITVSAELNPAGSTELTIETADGKFSLPAEPLTDDFASLTEPFPATFASGVSAGDLRRAILATEYAIDEQSGRFALGGLCFDITPESINVAGTDSRRLAVATVPAAIVGTLPDGFDSMEMNTRKILVPMRIVNELKTCLARMVDSEWVYVAGSTLSQLVIESENAFSIRGLQLEGRFPSYRDVIPRNPPAIITMNRKRLIQSLETAGLVCDEESRGVDMEFRAGSELLTVRGKSPSCGKSETTCPIVSGSGDIGVLTKDGAPFVITFDPKYLIESLRTMSDESASLAFHDSDTAMVLTSAEESTVSHIIMPLSNER
jgi:DNA polymerase-3 subunit beta